MGDDRPHIVLLGRPGTGKSVVGRELARAMQQPFLDIDAAPALPRRYRLVAHPSVADSELDELCNAELDWFATATAGSAPFVIAAPWSVAHRLRVDPLSVRIVLLEADDPVLVERLIADGVDTDDAFTIVTSADDADRQRAVRAMAHHTLDTTDAPVTDVVDLLTDALSAEQRARTN